MKILIVDDSLMDRKLLMNILNKAGFENEILQAGNGEDGLKLLLENKDDICLILLDWQMPKIDGIAFMRLVAQAPDLTSIPIVMISASGSDENKRYAREVNPNLADYIVKPYNSEVLINRIEKFIK